MKGPIASDTVILRPLKQACMFILRLTMGDGPVVVCLAGGPEVKSTIANHSLLLSIIITMTEPLLTEEYLKLCKNHSKLLEIISY